MTVDKQGDKKNLEKLFGYNCLGRTEKEIQQYYDFPNGGWTDIDATGTFNV